MKSPYTITLTPYKGRVNASDRPHEMARIRTRWRGELAIGADAPAFSVAGYTNPNEAIGAVVRAALVARGGNVHDVVDFVAGLFADLKVRNADTTLGRAIRIAAKHPQRVHPGAAVVLILPEEVETAPAPPQLAELPATLPLIPLPEKRSLRAAALQGKTRGNREVAK